MNKKNIYWGIFLIALATLTWEILLTRIFSATMFYHFVFVSISLAMMGFGCSGVIVFLFPRFFSEENCNNQLTIFSSLFSVTICLAIVVYLQIRPPELSKESFSSFMTLLKIFFFIFLPYFFSGLTVTLALKHYAKNVATLYCYDLVGAGLGCIFVIGMLFLVDGISLVLLTSFLAALSSVIFARAYSSKRLKTLSMALAITTCLAFVCNAYGYRFLKIKYVPGNQEDNIIFEEWNPLNRVTVTPFLIEGNNTLLINYDSTASANMYAFDGDKNKAKVLHDYIYSFYYQIRKNANVLIIGVGGGLDVLNAHITGQKTITGIEINPTIARLNRDIFREFNGNLFHQPGIRLLLDEGRSFVRHSEEKYDIIHIPSVDSYVASSSGAFMFNENTLYTVEAFKDYYRHLTNDGVLWISRWRFVEDYYLENFRVLTGVVRALEELGVKSILKNISLCWKSRSTAPWRQAILAPKADNLSLQKKSLFLKGNRAT